MDRAQAAKIADKYVLADGSPPAPGKIVVQTTGHQLEAHGKIGAMTAVANFIAFAPDGETWGGYTKKEAWTAFCEILDFPSHSFYKAVRRE
jgi:hypothetical protein